MKKLLLFVLLFVYQIGFSQSKGVVKGLVSDKENSNKPLPFANVFIKGTTIGATTDIDGKYTLSVPVGQHVLVFSFMGYKTIKKTIKVVKDKKLVVNTTIGANQGVALDEIKIKASIGREKESALLLEQKKAVSIKTTIGAQELSKKGVSNVAVAVTKTTGVSKEEGSNNIYVRGLGDRYNSTTFNGLPLPSNNPSLKNISLNIFSTRIVQAIDINKTYNSKIYGDFGGANINIVSKEHHGKPTMVISFGSGLNTNAIGQKNFYLQDGPNFSGFYNTHYPNNPLSVYGFTASWDKQTKTPVNGNFAIRGGKNFYVGKQGKLSVFGTASFSNNFKFKEGISRAGVNVQKIISTDYAFKSYDYNTNTTGMLNLSYKFNNKHTLKLNSLFINSSNQSLDDYFGTISTYGNAIKGGGFVRRSTFDRTTFFVNQLIGQHNISENWDVKWGLAFNKVSNIIPDRRQNMLVPVDDNNLGGPKKSANISPSNNNRYYENLEEKEYAVNAAVNYHFDKNKDDQYKGKITLGVSGTSKKADFDAIQFNFSINKYDVQPVVDINNLDAYFSQNGLANNYFTIRTFWGRSGDRDALNPQTYKGRQTIGGTFGEIQYQFSKKFTAVAGFRFERIEQKISWHTAVGGSDENDLKKTEFLPSVSLKYVLNDFQNLKLAVSKSYTLPQFKERAPFLFSEVNQDKVGNPYLRSSTNYNADLRWEWFPKSEELLSLTGFGKIISNPINELVVASAANDISYVNSGKKATIFGAELEIRKQLFNYISEKNNIDLSNKMTLGFNASYMHTNQDFDKEKIISETKSTRNVYFSKLEGRLTGASDLLFNTDISYLKEFSPDKNLLATLTFAYFSDRVYAVGSAGEGNLIDQPVGTLDFILKSKLAKRISMSLAVKNILDPTIKRVQDVQNVTVLSFKKGVNVGLSLSYKLD